MDLGTHAMAGLAVGAASARRVPLVAVLATGVIAAVLPDLDAVLWVINLRLYYEWHRVFTHTLFTLPLIAAAAAAAGLAIGRRRQVLEIKVGVTSPPRYPVLLVIAGISLVLHLLLDLLCDFPLRLLYPATRHDFALYLIAYSHPAFTIGFVAIFIAFLMPLARPRSD